MSDAETSQLRIVSMIEQETARGWRYEVTWQSPRGLSVHILTLSWVDHDYWCGGREAPSMMVRRVFECFVCSGRAIPDRADCSTLRRLYPELDEALGVNSARGQAAA